MTAILEAFVGYPNWSTTITGIGPFAPNVRPWLHVVGVPAISPRAQYAESPRRNKIEKHTRSCGRRTRPPDIFKHSRMAQDLCILGAESLNDASDRKIQIGTTPSH